MGNSRPSCLACVGPVILQHLFENRIRGVLKIGFEVFRKFYFAAPNPPSPQFVVGIPRRRGPAAAPSSACWFSRATSVASPSPFAQVPSEVGSIYVERNSLKSFETTSLGWISCVCNGFSSALKPLVESLCRGCGVVRPLEYAGIRVGFPYLWACICVVRMISVGRAYN